MRHYYSRRKRNPFNGQIAKAHDLIQAIIDRAEDKEPGVFRGQVEDPENLDRIMKAHLSFMPGREETAEPPFQYSPLNVACTILDPRVRAKFVDLYMFDMNREDDKSYRHFIKAIEEETDAELMWEDGYPRIPSSWTEKKVVKKYGKEKEYPSEFDEAPWEDFGLTQEGFMEDFSTPQRRRRRRRRKRRRKRSLRKRRY
jgi:hypothetical protein